MKGRGWSVPFSSLLLPLPAIPPPKGPEDPEGPWGMQFVKRDLGPTWTTVCFLTH